MIRKSLQILVLLSFLPSATGLALALHEHEEHHVEHCEGDHSHDSDHSEESSDPPSPHHRSTCGICHALTAGFVAFVATPTVSAEHKPLPSQAAWPPSQGVFVQDMPRPISGRAPPIA